MTILWHILALWLIGNTALLACTSFFYGQFNYLLNRDLDPASQRQQPGGIG